MTFMAPRMLPCSSFRIHVRLLVLAVCANLWLIHQASAATVEVTCASVIKLQHDKTKYRLHSHEVSYGSGSGQQSVTGFSGGDDGNSFWEVHAGYGEAPCVQGSPFSDGAIIRLQHQRTRKWLHSHKHYSPLSNNQEVSCYGGDAQSDTGDNWKVVLDGKGKVWAKDQKVRLQHVDTSAYLHSHDKKYSRPIAGQTEVCATNQKVADNIWLATEGAYFATTAQLASS